MGKISDILEKSGVELGSEKSCSELPQQAETAGRQESPQHSLGSVAGSWDERLTKVVYSSSQASESFRVLRSRILFPPEGKKRPQTILVTSCDPKEGKSFVSANLAVAMARGLDQYSLLVDCDLRSPSLARMFGLSSVCRRGLSDYLREECELSELIHNSTVEKLSILASGNPPVNPAELLGSVRMAQLVKELSGRYADRFIIFDSSPYEVASESIVLSKEVDGVVVVVGYGKSEKSRVKSMIDQIGREKIIGVVFNGTKNSYLRKKLFDSYGQYEDYYGA